ncbi:hypothetical protein SteCoe_28785 [Stentor coeruleus]|uniref:Translin-associated factor X-interacting protein 1 N-terminal domain-containing protein n=1 Tax=Stentor coeruleus TaxID=5963 RepID=A0A1R2B7G5_9CILI|nr:hypothetical protein SteCoe_28785 [Stentor coeruleus]
MKVQIKKNHYNKSIIIMSKIFSLGPYLDKSKSKFHEIKHELSYSFDNIKSFQSKKTSLPKFMPIAGLPNTNSHSHSALKLRKISINRKFKSKIDPHYTTESDNVNLLTIKNKYLEPPTFEILENILGPDNKVKIINKDEDLYNKIIAIEDTDIRYNTAVSALDEILLESNPYNKTLTLIKSEYHKHIELLSKKIDQEKNDKLELEKCNRALSSELEKIMELYKKTSTDHQELYKKYIKITDTLIKISNVKVNKFELTKKNWKKILKKNRYYELIFSKVNKDLEYYKEKSQKLYRILERLEKAGCNVSEAIETESKECVYIKNVVDEEEAPDSTDYEDLCSGRDKKEVCRKKVPELDLKGILDCYYKASAFESESESSGLPF